MTEINFHKMHAYLNDFIIIEDNFVEIIENPEYIKQLCNRRSGIGADQLILISNENNTTEFSCLIFNSDGSEAYQCGNGLRCVARLLADKNNLENLTIKTKSGNYKFNIGDTSISCDMGTAIFAPKDIPLEYPNEQAIYKTTIEGKDIEFSAVSVGNPHVIITSYPKDLSATNIYHYFNSTNLLLDGANVDFMEVINRNHIKLRVFERGALETPSCGSAACAATAAGIKLNLLDHNVTVSQAGGDMQVCLKDSLKNSLILTGSTNYCFNGLVSLNNTSK